MSKDYSSHYSDNNFWDKLKNVATKAGKQVVEKALWLYYALQNPQTPKWAITTIIGALGYFIFPLDLIPDFIPVAGYTDDLGVLAGAIASVATYITDVEKRKASQKIKEWFGDSKRSDAKQ